MHKATSGMAALNILTDSNVKIDCVISDRPSRRPRRSPSARPRLVIITFIVLRVSRKPAVLIFLAPILVDATFQENLFWYISIFDQFALYLLLTREPPAYWFDPLPSRRRRVSYQPAQLATA